MTKEYNVILKGNAVYVFTDAELANCRYSRKLLGKVEARSKTDVYKQIHEFVEKMIVEFGGTLNKPKPPKPPEQSAPMFSDTPDWFSPKDL